MGAFRRPPHEVILVLVGQVGPSHAVDHGDGDPRLNTPGVLLLVLGQPSLPPEPVERPLDDPPHFWISNVFCPGRLRMMSSTHRQCSATHPRNVFYPRRPTPGPAGKPPDPADYLLGLSQSWTFAGRTASPQISPRVSTSSCRFLLAGPRVRRQFGVGLEFPGTRRPSGRCPDPRGSTSSAAEAKDRLSSTSRSRSRGSRQARENDSSVGFKDRHRVPTDLDPGETPRAVCPAANASRPWSTVDAGRVP